MSYTTAQSAIAGANLADDAAKLAWATATVYAWRTYFVSYRSLRDLLARLGAADAKGQTQLIAAAVEASDPLAHQIMLIPGDESGSSGGVDLSLPEAQAMIRQLTQGGLITQSQADALLDLARSNPHPRYAEWGLPAFDANTLANLADRAKWESLSRDVDARLLPAVDAALANPILVTVTTEHRDAIVQAVQVYKSTVEANQDISGMPVDAVALWASVRVAA